MTTNVQSESPFTTLEIKKVVDIAAPIEIAFEALLDELGPDAKLMDDTAYPFKLEPWVGGRWYRDLGNNAGHLWGHVQVIKPPNLLEIWGPLMMSYPAINHIQYRFTTEGSGTRLTFMHRGMGLIQRQHSEGMPQGWGRWAENIRDCAERKTAQRKK